MQIPTRHTSLNPSRYIWRDQPYSGAEGSCFFILSRRFCCLSLPSARMKESMPQTMRTFEPPFTGVPGAVAEIRAGRMVVVVDDENRENEGDLTLAAEHVTPEAINFMARYGAASSAWPSPRSAPIICASFP